MRSWPVLLLAFVSLIALVALTGFGAARQANQIYVQTAALYERQRQTERTLSEVRAELHQSGVFVRDYLLDPSHLSAGYYRNELLAVRSSMAAHLTQLGELVGAAHLDRLRQGLNAYWDTLEPLFTWTPQQKAALSYSFLRRQVLPKRDAAAAMTREIRDLTETEARQRREAMDQRQREFRRGLTQMVVASLCLALFIAVVSGLYIARLERRAEEQHHRTEQAERELRKLSQQLVRAQEDERRFLSRELHDEVGQKLTALRIELAGLDQLCGDREFEARLQDTKQLAEQTLRAVRDLALGLRPSMLDDLGLGPALEWQARDFSRRSNVPVTVEIDGDLNALPDRHRTCVFRVVQEALTNCVRHAGASAIRVSVQGDKDAVSVMVQDDGIGMADDSRGRGLGLIGIEERARELGGDLAITSQPNKGTTLTLRLPLHSEAAS